MKPPNIPLDEPRRLAALKDLYLLDTETDPVFDHITQSAQMLCDAPIALITLVDSDRQWFKSRAGLDIRETARDISFCAHAILDDQLFVVNDASRDGRFAGNPLVLGAPCIRAYAGMPLRAPTGERIGTLCVIDTVPRSFSEKELASLRLLAAIVEDKLRWSKNHFRLAYHDPLTKLPNRLLMQDQLKLALLQAERHKLSVALLYLNIDRFRNINQSLGHTGGDALLKMVTHRIENCVDEKGILARIGADEFVIILPALTSHDAIPKLAAKILENISRPFEIEGQEIIATASIGVSVFPRDGNKPNALITCADRALCHAKEAGRNAVSFFAAEMNIDAAERLHLHNYLRRAIERKEFVLHYQPQIDLASGEIVGVEALIRWHHRTLGLLPPGRFIAAAEESGLIVEIGEWVLREACREAMAWQRDGLPPLVVAVNLSALQFKRSNFEECVSSALAEAGLDAPYLELELTESILISDTETTLATVQRLKKLGVGLSIDDFGTGYSSLAYLRRFKVDKLKIDQSFISDLGSGTEDVAIVQAIIQMATSLGLKTIAEGVESPLQLATLRELKCDISQGYLFAKPMPGDEFRRYARDSLEKCVRPGSGEKRDALSCPSIDEARGRRKVAV
jgi:diguanylate cyclase (GGDEF)-like protein